MKAVATALALLAFGTTTSLARAEEAKAGTPPSPRPRWFLETSLGVGRGQLFTGPLAVESTRVPLRMAFGARVMHRLEITAAELVLERGTTENGVSVPRVALGAAAAYAPFERLHLGLGVHGGAHFVVRKSSLEPGPYGASAPVLFRLAVGTSASATVDVVPLAEHHWVTVSVRGEVDWVFKTSFHTASLSLGYAFR